MKQRWLIKPLSENVSTPTLQLDPATHDELITLMATAIESVYLPHPETHGALTDERTTTASQDQPGTPSS